MIKNKRITSIFAIIYILTMIYLLFLMRIDGISEAYELSFTEHLNQYTNFIPFRSISRYSSTLAGGNGSMSVAIINLIGNIIMFIPMGIILPVYFDKARRFFGSVLITIFTILCVELIQFITFTGTFDVDDIILNFFGAIVGFCIWKQYKK